MTQSQEEIIKKNTVDIRGRDYLTVAGRVSLLHEQGYKSLAIRSEVLAETPVTVRVTVEITTNDDKVITTQGISAANPTKVIEKMSPYEVAETSALGRALGFAGYGLVDTIASADEMVKANVAPAPKQYTADDFHEEMTRKGVLTDEEKQMQEVVDEATETERDCPKHPGKTAYRKTTPWGAEQWSHKEPSEPKGYCNINIA